MGKIPVSRDLVTFGESMLRLSVVEGEQIETATDLQMRVAGAESNVAVIASQLGTQVAWLSKLPDSPLTRRIEHALRSHGVTPVISQSDNGRVGTYYIEPGPKPRGTNVLYDRSNAAIRTAEPADFPLDQIRDTSAFYTSGITLALSNTLTNTAKELLRTANEAGTHTIFDFNYRSKLWSPSEARETCSDVFDLIDTLVIAERDINTVLEYEGDAFNIADSIKDDYNLNTIVITKGSEGVIALHNGTQFSQQAFDTDTLDAIGTGDAFVGGFLACRLTDGTMSDALTYGAAVAALNRTVTGDVMSITSTEVERLITDKKEMGRCLA